MRGLSQSLKVRLTTVKFIACKRLSRFVNSNCMLAWLYFYFRFMKANHYGNYPCPCCGYYTFGAPLDSSFDICPVCYWEDDGVQLRDPTYAGGANKLSLAQAQLHFAQHGTCEPGLQRYVRLPLPDELPDGVA
jgi:hypothetical protein